MTEYNIVHEEDLKSPKEKLRKTMDYKVVKSNELITEYSDNLSSRQYRIVLNMISRQNPLSESLEPVEYDIEELAVYLGVDMKGRTNIHRLYNDIKEITSKKFWFYKDENKMVTASWVKDAEIDQSNDKVTLTFDDKLESHLLNLQGKFTTFQLLFMSLITNKHYIVLYEILYSSLMYKHERTIDIDIEELRQRILTKEDKGTKYGGNTGKFNQLISRAIADINKKTNISVLVTSIRKGRKIKALRFTVKKKTCVECEVLTESYFEYGARNFAKNTDEFGYSEEIYQKYKDDIDHRITENIKKKKKITDAKTQNYQLDDADEEALKEIFPEKESDDVPGDMIADAEKAKKQNPQLNRGTGLPVINWLHDKNALNIKE